MHNYLTLCILGSFGNFTVELGSFSDDQFLSQSSEQYPVFKSFQDRIYVQYSVKTVNSDIVIRAKSCHATPTSKSYDTPQYQIFADRWIKKSFFSTFLRQKVITNL